MIAATTRACRKCGCTQTSACMTATGACYWVEPDLCSGCTGDAIDPRAHALAAASAAADATAELLRFVREGDGMNSRFDIDVVEQLLDAAKMVMEIDCSTDDERADVLVAVTKYLEGWVG